MYQQLPLYQRIKMAHDENVRMWICCVSDGKIIKETTLGTRAVEQMIEWVNMYDSLYEMWPNHYYAVMCNKQVLSFEKFRRLAKGKNPKETVDVKTWRKLGVL